MLFNYGPAFFQDAEAEGKARRSTMGGDRVLPEGAGLINIWPLPQKILIESGKYRHVAPARKLLPTTVRVAAHETSFEITRLRV